ncbi:unnamed protein product [Agarophyton chilense]|eukprot:gb/GEZJ01003202.1/.p1 GENE.gb/GEZJ01003202.1/~~gb/GEZJ01003202.1/.p1  ORF type:complete len:448 (+),score=40.55 gb/GEZJ01003202.1/:770-2113(+)
MIRNDHLTYAGAESVFRNWRPQDDSIYEMVFSALITVFVYQLAKLVLELCLGQKRSGEIPVSDLYLYVVLSGLSFSLVVSSFRSIIQLAQEAEDLSLSTAMKSKQSRRTAWTVGKFALLLLAIPSIQVVGLFFGVEGETDISFKDVNFGGLALGLVKDVPTITQNNTSRCQKLETRLGHGETERTNFFRCYGISEPLPFETGANLGAGSFLVFLMSTSTNIGLTVVVPGKRWISFLSLDINDGKNPYSLRNVLSLEQKSRILEVGVQKMVKSCPSAVQTKGVDVSWVFPSLTESESEQPRLSVLVECADYDENHLVDVAFGMLNNVSFIHTDHFDVSESINAEEFVSGDDLVFFRRRGSNASLLAMLIATVVVITGRIIVGLVLYNEGPKALEVILKDGLAVKCCDSLLQYEQIVHYTSEREKSNGGNSCFWSDTETCSSGHTDSGR